MAKQLFVFTITHHNGDVFEQRLLLTQRDADRTATLIRSDLIGSVKSVTVHSYEQRRDMITAHAWGTWTKNGLGLDADDRAQTEKTVQDAVNNTYVDGITDMDWLAATVGRLTGN